MNVIRIGVSLVSENIRSRGLLYSKHLCDVLLSILSRIVKPAHLANLLVRKLRLRMKLAMSAKSRAVLGVATLFHHVCHVFLVRSKEQMGWIDTTRIIAFMKHPKAVRNGSIGQFPRNAVSGKPSIVNLDVAVAPLFFLGEFPPNPLPTLIGVANFNTFPKPTRHIPTLGTKSIHLNRYMGWGQLRQVNLV